MIVAFGDSITAGQHATKSYADILGFHNAGVPGDTTELALERFDRDVAALKPAMVVIQFGHNDANVWKDSDGFPRVSLTDYRTNLMRLVWRTRNMGAQPFIVGPYESLRDSVYARRCWTYDCASRVAARATYTPWIGMWGWIHPEHLLPDGLHLNDAGHEAYAERIGWYTQQPSSTKASISVVELPSARSVSLEARTAAP